ncbi:carnitinyl-CoA dehydratase [Motiliproteus sp. MSK22-1]|uniref:carnitinyl-CoA dehydratase n=1 Tax=Motiliproteus sp. MSK22-1 TaxID=1897630 RepID=UPI00097614AC|nr:carnitinyl-CoA dehydratase [Motiliproteus sp. MSK22-1]OMH29151.1 carnitinyl-CoA dehydratase [Motiliproteus sp. MSK22-1]
MSQYSNISTCREKGILEIVLDRPKANAIDAATSHALGEIFINFRDDPTLGVAIITGAGERFFSAGWDLKSAAEGEAPDADFGPGGFAGLTELFDLNKPVIAAVNGFAAGGGFELALACDLIVTVDHAQFFLSEAQLGIIPDSGGVFRLPRRLPVAIATEMLLTGRRMDAHEAARWGLVNRVCSPVELMDQARQLAHQLLHSAPLSVAAIKEIIRATEQLSIEESYQLQRSGELPVYQKMLRSQDAIEGPLAFSEKRTPVWQGK